ncbi:MAG: alpha/beta hydrolase [Christensenella sp.]
MKTILERIKISIFTSFSFLFIVWPFSPIPACLFLRNIFRFGTASKPENYAEIHARTKSVVDLCYDSSNYKQRLDIVLPAEVHEKLPVIFWMHGGAYIGGDKSDVTEYAVQIAEHGYAVININYPLAPEVRYPAGVMSIPQVYSFIAEHAEEYSIDLSRIYFAGDSAGAQMSAQFVTAQLDGDYAALTKIPQIISPENIRGTALFCGFYDAPAYLDNLKPYAFSTFLIKNIFWGVTGFKNWRDNSTITEASVLNYIPPSFPPTFITDGNIGSFTDQAIAYSQALENIGTRVTTALYPREDALLRHEYQFNMKLPHSVQTFEKLISFLDSVKK